MSNKIITGIYLVEKKWERIWLKNKFQDTVETLDYFTFHNLLFQSFDSDYIKKILEALNSEKKLIIDFDKDIVKVIVSKDQPFIKALAPYFNPAMVEEWYNNEEYDESNIYNNF